MATLLVTLLTYLALCPEEAKAPPPPLRPAPAAASDTAAPKVSPAPLPWQLGAGHRYVWIRDGEKVGETQFRIEEAVENDQPVYKVKAKRTYDHLGSSQRGEELTILSREGVPLRFDESLDVGMIGGLQAHQQTSVRMEEGKARVRFVSNGRDDKPALRESEIPPGTFLIGSQAVEHWAVFAARFPADVKTHKVNLFYPDFNKVFEMTFQLVGKEALDVKGQKMETSRYAFQSPEKDLRGDIWLDAKSRLIQIEFPPATDKQKPLRVLLVPD